MSYIDIKELLAATNGGLEIIFMVYPNAQGCEADTRKKFKVRDSEKTASAAIKKLGDGNWVVTDFGGDQKPRNGVQCYVLEEYGEHASSEDYKKALQILAAHFNVAGADEKPIIKADFEMKPAIEGQKDGDYFFESKDFTPAELELLGGKYFTQKMAMDQKLWSLQSYTYVRKSKKTGELTQYINKSTKDYPIFQFVFENKETGRWGKRLEPKAHKKGDRFRYFGTRPKDYIMGLDLVRKKFNDINQVDEEEYDSQDPDAQKEERRGKKLPEIIWCSGDRDAFSVMSLGYPVIWLNSESAKLRPQDFSTIENLAWKVCRIGDIDAPGIRQSHRLCMENLDLHDVILPAELREKRDHRGNPCKDVRDFLQYNDSYKLKELIKLAIPYRMWDVRWKFDAVKKHKVKTYEVNPLQMYNFLEKNGFYRFRIPNTKTGYIYIHIQDNKVEEVDPVDIKAFVNKFLEERRLEPEIRNTFFKAQNRMGEQSLSNLSLIDIDFTDYTPDSQMFYFENKTWEVTKDGITEYKPHEIDKKVWADEVMQHKVKVKDAPFQVFYDEEEERLDIKILRKDCLFLQYLINTSRIYWKEQQELLKDKRDLTDDQMYEQRHHLMNKLYSLGYLLHRYKDRSRPWAVFAMDNKLSEDGESHGGSGKSIAYNAVRYFMKSVSLPGRNPKLTENAFIYDNVTTHTDFILVDDANQYLKFDFFYSDLTGDMLVNPKHGKQYELSFEESPKFAFTSNFALRNTDPSTERRLLYTVFSDYYHHNKDDEYERDWNPELEFGKNLFQDFDENEWNEFYNTMGHALVMYLNNHKINPPMENVEKRNMITQMSQDFHDWAEVYFSEQAEHCDMFLPRTVAIEDYYLHNTRVKGKWSTNKFTKSLKIYCKYKGFTYNPSEVCNNGPHRIVKKHKGTAEDHIYIQAYSNQINTAHEAEPFSPGSNDKSWLEESEED